MRFAATACRRAAGILARMLGLALAAASASAATIVCLGDSLTAGYGLPEEQAYPALIEGLAKAEGRTWKVVNAGISGDTTAGGLRRVGWVLKAKPDAVLVALGGNDGLRGLPIEQTRNNLREIVSRVQAHGAKALLAGMQLPTNYGDDYRERFGRVFAELATEQRAPLLPFLLEGVGGVRALNQADGIHPTAEGQAMVAKHVYAFLRAQLEPGAAASATAASATAGAPR